MYFWGAGPGSNAVLAIGRSASVHGLFFSWGTSSPSNLCNIAVALIPIRGPHTHAPAALSYPHRRSAGHRPSGDPLRRVPHLLRPTTGQLPHALSNAGRRLRDPPESSDACPPWHWQALDHSRCDANEEAHHGRRDPVRAAARVVAVPQQIAVRRCVRNEGGSVKRVQGCRGLRGYSTRLLRPRSTDRPLGRARAVKREVLNTARKPTQGSRVRARGLTFVVASTTTAPQRRWVSQGGPHRRIPYCIGRCPEMMVESVWKEQFPTIATPVAEPTRQAAWSTPSVGVAVHCVCRCESSLSRVRLSLRFSALFGTNDAQ